MEPHAPEPAWEEITPVLDDAIANLGETDRHAILLRYFERKELKEVGHALGSSEEAAKKKVARAVEKLRAFFMRRGVVLSTAALTGALTSNAAQAAPPTILSSVNAALAANAASTLNLPLAQATMKTMLYAKLQTAGAIAGILLLAAGAGTILAQQTARPKAAASGSSTTADRTTPLGALRDFADALDQSDSNRVLAAMHAVKPAAQQVAAAIGDAVAAERDFKRAVIARFGNKPVKVINFNFGQAAFKTGEDLSDTVTYTDADHAIVRLPSRSRPDKPHATHMVRVDAVWKIADEDTPGIDDGAADPAAIFRGVARLMRKTETEIRAGSYQSFDEMARVLTTRVVSSLRPAGTDSPSPM